MARDSTSVASKNASEAASVYKKSQEAKAKVPETDQTPTAGKNIPIVLGAVKLTGDVIWISSYFNKQNECRAHVAICFGRNPFGRPISLMSLTSGGNYIYKRSGGDVVDPPKAVRFYDGTQTTADPKIMDIEGSGNAPAFKGYIYAVLEDVKVGDFAAEFTDNGSEPSSGVTNTLICDSELTGVNMVYDFETGMYYGVKNPLTYESYFIRSADGCTIFDMRQITFEPNDGAYNPDVDDASQWDRFFGNIHPIRCSRIIAMPSMLTIGAIAGSPPYVPEQQRGLHLYMDPGIGMPVRTDEFLYLADNDFYNIIDMPDPEIDYIESYPIPGSGTQYAILRKFNKGTYLVAAYAIAGFGLVANGNIACTIIDTLVQDSYVKDGWTHATPTSTIADELGMVIGDTLHTAYAFDAAIQDHLDPVNGWNVHDCPEVDDIIYGYTSGLNVELGGCKLDGGTLHAYRITHSAMGMSTVTANISIPSGMSYSGMQFDAKNDLLLISVTGSLPETFLPSRVYTISRLGFVSYIVTASNISLMPKSQARAFDGKAVLSNADNSEIYTLDTQTEELKQIYDGAASDNPVVDLSRNLINIPTVTGMTSYALDQIESGEIALTDLITDCCALKGYSSSDLMFQGLETATVRGLLINSTVRMSDLFNRLGTLFSFVFVETDQKLKFLKKRSGGSLTTDLSLTEEYLARSGGDDGWVRTIQRASGNNLLGGMDLEFMDPAKRYENSTIKIRRPAATFDIGASARIETLSVPVTLDASDAYVLMYESFYTTLQKQTRVGFTLMPEAARVEPGDCVSVTVDGVETTGIVVRVTVTEAFTQDVELEVYQGAGETQISAPAVPVLPTPGTGSPTLGQYIPLELPFLRIADYVDATKSIRYHGLTTSGFASWSWADLYRSLDGANFTKILQYESQPMTVAKASNGIGDPPMPFASDDTNTITITVVSGDPADFSTVSYVEQMNGASLCAYGSPGRWEIISYRTVTENSDGTLTLSGLQRGLYGTHVLYREENFTAHKAGDTLVRIDLNNLVATQEVATDVGLSEYFTIQPSTGALAPSVPSVFRNVAFLQFQPAELVAIHDEGALYMSVYWNEVGAIPSIWRDSGGSTPMHADVTYTLTLTTNLGTFNYEVSNGFVELNVTDLIGDYRLSIEQYIYSITLTPYVVGIGYGYPVSGRTVVIVD